MIFKIESETYDTSDMLSLVLNGIYLTIYLHPERHLAFLQTFDEICGVNISLTNSQQCTDLLDLLNTAGYPAILSHQEQLRAIVSPPDNRGSVKSESGCQKRSNPRLTEVENLHDSKIRYPQGGGLSEGVPNPPETAAPDLRLVVDREVPNGATIV